MPLEGQPDVIIKPSADEGNRHLLVELGRLTRDNSEFVDASLDLYAQHPDALTSFVAFIEENPERFPILKTVVHALERDADYDLDIPDAVMDTLKKDVDFPGHSGATSPEEKKRDEARIRVFWLRKGLERIKAA